MRSNKMYLVRMEVSYKENNKYKYIFITPFVEEFQRFLYNLRFHESSLDHSFLVCGWFFKCLGSNGCSNSQEQHRRKQWRGRVSAACVATCCRKRKNKFHSTDEAWDMLNQHPVNNAITLYTTVMVPKTGYIETKVPDDSVLQACHSMG